MAKKDGIVKACTFGLLISVSLSRSRFLYLILRRRVRFGGRKRNVLFSDFSRLPLLLRLLSLPSPRHFLLALLRHPRGRRHRDVGTSAFWKSS